MADLTRRDLGRAAIASTLATIAGVFPALGQGANPIRIGYSMSLSGGLAANGRSSLLAHRIWAEDVNAQGGILGRPVQIVSYDDPVIVKEVVRCRSGGVSDFRVSGVALGVEADVASRRPVSDLT